MKTKQEKTGKAKTVNRTENRKYDSAWKKVIRDMLEDFLEFFFPVIYEAVDFSVKPEFLDKELKEIDPDGNQGDREADVLFKVKLKDGSTKYICIIVHVEVQGSEKPDFMKRMFIYFYRAFEKERTDEIPIISAAVLTDDNPNYRPNEYRLEYLGFKLSMQIPIVKILDFLTDKELYHKMTTSQNPMAMIVKAQLKSMDVQHEDANVKFEVTKELIRQCYESGYSVDRIRLILKFMDYVIRLPGVLKQQIKTIILKKEEENKMDYYAIWERDAFDEGEKVGKEKGKEIGEKRTKKIIEYMRKNGRSIQEIADLTGLNTKEIEELIALEQTTH